MASVWRRSMVYLGLVDDEEFEEYEPYDEAPQPTPLRRPARQERVEPVYEPEPPVGVGVGGGMGGGLGPSLGGGMGGDMGTGMGSTMSSRSGGAVRTLGREESGITVQRSGVVRPISPVSSPRVQVVAPGSFNDAKDIGDKLKAAQPVIVNLQGVDRDLCRRLIDFASGLTFGLAGQMEKVADHVFLLTPTNVEVSAEEKRRLQERGLYHD